MSGYEGSVIQKTESRTEEAEGEVRTAWGQVHGVHWGAQQQEQQQPQQPQPHHNQQQLQQEAIRLSVFTY